MRIQKDVGLAIIVTLVADGAVLMVLENLIAFVDEVK
jgi:hypothetical protein